MSRMAVAWTSDRPNASRSAWRAASTVADPRMMAITRSMWSRATSRPSSTWARSSARPQAVAGPPDDHLEAVLEVVAAEVVEAERGGHAVDQHHVVDAERLLHRGQPVQLGQHGVGVGAGALHSIWMRSPFLRSLRSFTSVTAAELPASRPAR